MNLLFLPELFYIKFFRAVSIYRAVNFIILISFSINLFSHFYLKLVDRIFCSIKRVSNRNNQENG